MKAQMMVARFVGPAMAIAAVFALPSFALAHPGDTMGGSGLWQGFTHPLAGWDHFCAMTAVGLWAAQRGGRSMWIVPATFLAMMGVGFAFASPGISIPLVEAGIAASLLVFGILVVAAARLRLPVGLALVGVFALFHGHAHGTETIVSTGAWIAGFSASSIGVFAGAVGLGWLAQGNWQSAQLVRVVGGAVAVCGLCVSTY